LLGGYNPDVRRIGRYIINGLAVLSLVLCVATVGLWGAAAFGVRQRTFERGGRIITIGIAGDHAWVTTIAGWPSGTLRPGERVTFFPEPGGSSWSAPGCWSDRGMAEAITYDGRYRRRGAYFNARLMFWLPAALSAILPLFYLAPRVWARQRGRRRALEGRCSACGYDLIPSPKPVIAILPGEQQQQQQPTPRP
jgi:hypothetical protein